MDLNFKRRRADRAIAREVAESFFKASRPLFAAGAATVPPEVFAHHFGVVCRRHNLAEADARRVLCYVPASLAAMQGELDAVGNKFRLLDQHLSAAAHSG